MTKRVLTPGSVLPLLSEDPPCYQPTKAMRAAVVSVLAELLLQALAGGIDDRAKAPAGDGHEG